MTCSVIRPVEKSISVPLNKELITYNQDYFGLPGITMVEVHNLKFMALTVLEVLFVYCKVFCSIIIQGSLKCCRGAGRQFLLFEIIVIKTGSSLFVNPCSKMSRAWHS